MSHGDQGCERLHDVAAYVLGGLEEDEAIDFARHLESCLACRRELAELAPVVALLPTAVPEQRAGRELGLRVMAVVRSEADLLNAAGAGADRPAAPRRRRLRFGPLAGIAAAATLGVGVAVGLALNGGAAPQLHTRAVVAAAGASAVLSQTGNRAELHISRLPPPPRGRIYELWIKHPGRSPSPTGVLFGVNRSGNTAIVVPGSLRGVTRLMVTDEPPGGSLSPTGATALTVTPA